MRQRTDQTPDFRAINAIMHHYPLLLVSILSYSYGRNQTQRATYSAIDSFNQEWFIGHAKLFRAVDYKLVQSARYDEFDWNVRVAHWLRDRLSSAPTNSKRPSLQRPLVANLRLFEPSYFVVAAYMNRRDFSVRYVVYSLNLFEWTIESDISGNFWKIDDFSILDEIK